VIVGVLVSGGEVGVNIFVGGESVAVGATVGSAGAGTQALSKIMKVRTNKEMRNKLSPS
jgi:hypothetical protein